jgi:WD40 repeat protein
LGVSIRTIRHWEGGTAFPTSANLKQMIAIYLLHGGFSDGHEREEAQALWAQADESAVRLKASFDDAWFEGLLTHHRLGPAGKASSLQTSQLMSAPPLLRRADWGGAPDAATLYGREQELATLQRWVLGDRCRVVALLGMGGIGKTLLAVRFAQGVAGQFTRVLWRSLRHAPPLGELLADCLRSLEEQPSPTLPDTIDLRVTLLVELLRQQRCLLILDNIETLVEAGSLAGNYRKGYEGYGMLFQRVAETTHQSCLLLTSREMLSELEPLAGASAVVRGLKVSGLSSAATKELLQDKSLFGTPEIWDKFSLLYSGCPLALKIAAATVQDLFGGDLAAYLRESSVTLFTLRQLLDQQFERLSPLEQRVLTWLAIARDGVSLEQLSAELVAVLPRQDLLAALKALRRRSLIERNERDTIFTLLPVVMEYVSDRLVAKLADEIIQSEFALLSIYALMQSQSYDYIRESQSRMLVQPVLNRLLAYFSIETALEEHLRMMVQRLRALPVGAQGYAGGNLVNLIVHLRGDLRGWNLSQLVLRQAFLAEAEAQEANFAGADIRYTRFMEPFETISALTLSPDGQYLAIGSYSGQIRIWHVAEGKPLWSAKGDTRRIWSLAFSPNAALVASGGYQGQVRVWDADSGRLLKELTGHTGWVRAVVFSPDARTLVTTGDDATVRLWDVQQGTCHLIMYGHQGLVWCATFDPEGTSLFTGGVDGTIRTWDVASGACVRILQKHSDGVFSVAAHPDGTLLASGGEDGRIFLWDMQTGQWLRSLDRLGTGTATIAFNPEGTILASGSNEGAIQLWEIMDSQHIQSAKLLHGHRNRVNWISFAADGLLATASFARRARIWDAQSGKLLRSFQGYSRLMSALAFSPDGRLLAQGDGRGIIRIWDLQNGNCSYTVRGHSGPIWHMAFSPDGRTFASSSEDRDVKLWSAEGAQCLKTFTGHTASVWALAFSPDGTILASTGTDREIKLWETSCDRGTSVLKNLQGSTSWNWSIAFAPDGRTLVSGGTNGEVSLWSVANGLCLNTFQHTDSVVGAVSFSPDGQTLFSSSNHELLKQWDIASGRSLLTIPQEAFGNRMKAIAFDEDAILIATAHASQPMQLWRINPDSDAHQVFTLTELGGEIWSVALNPAQRTVAASDDEGMIILWDTVTGAVKLRLAPDRPYERMNIQDTKGLNEAQRTALKALGAVEVAVEAQIG